MIVSAGGGGVRWSHARPPLGLELVVGGRLFLECRVKHALVLSFMAVIGAALPVLNAADTRLWMSLRSGVFEATLGGIDGTDVTLVNAAGKEVRFRADELSPADRQYLVEVGGGDTALLVGRDSATPEKDLRIDAATMKRLDEKLGFDNGSEGIFDLLETPHFIIGTAGGVRPQATAETAERLWHGMAFQHMNFRRDWGDRRMLILLVEDRGAYKTVGEWYQNQLAGRDQQEAAQQVRATWDRVGATGITLSEEIMSRFGLMDRAPVFNVTDAGRYRRAMSPFPVHTIAKALLTKQMGAVTAEGDEGHFAVTTGHGYFKEILLAGKTETNLLDAFGTGGDEISSKSGFADGTSWARTLRPLVRRGQVKPELAQLLSWKHVDLTPERLVLIYSFAYYMQGDSARLSAYAALVRRVEADKKVPGAAEIAALFGFEDVEALEKDWTEFISSNNFK